MMNEKMIIRGERIAVRIIIMNAICTLLTSVVIRVTSDADENLSMFSNEKSCTRRKRLRRRFRANPADAVAQVEPAHAPNRSEKKASTTSTMPHFTMTSSPQPASIWLMSVAIINGMTQSIATSKTTSSIVMMVAFLYSPTLFSIFRTIVCFLYSVVTIICHAAVVFTQAPTAPGAPLSVFRRLRSPPRGADARENS